MSGLYLPPEPARERELRIFLVYRQADVANFLKLLEKCGGMFRASVRVPFGNSSGCAVGSKHAILYEHTEEIHMEVMT